MASSVIAVKITGDASSAKKAFKEAELAGATWSEKVNAQLTGVGDKFKNIGSKISDTGMNLSTKVTLPLVGLGAAAFTAAADVQDAMGAVDQVFGSASGSVQKWANELPSYYGIAKGEALTYASNMGSLMKNIGGMTEAEASKQVQALIPLAGDLASMFGGSTSDAMYALQGALKGNTTMLDNYGMSATAAQIEAKALEMGLKEQGKELSAAAKQQAILALITEQSGDAQGNAAREAEGASGSMRAFTTDIKNLAADLGTQLLPIFTPMIQKVGEWVTKFSQLDDNTKNLIVKIGLVVAAVGPALLIFGKIVSSVGSIISGFGSLIKVGGQVIGVVQKLSAALMANPAALIAVAIIALGAALYLAYQHCEGFRNVVDAVGRWLQDNLWPILKKVGEFIGDVFVAAVKAIAWYFTEVWLPAMKSIWSFIKDKVVPIVTSIATTFWNVGTTVASVIGAIVAWVIGIPGRISSTVSTMWNGIKDGITGAYDWVASKILGIIAWVQGLKDNIASKASGMWDGFKDAFKSAMNWVIDKWNSLKFTLPKIDLGPLGKVGGWTVGVPQIPRFHTGGVVGGNNGAETLALLKAGETVRTEDQERALARNLGSSGPVININVTGSVISEQDLLRFVRDGLKKDKTLYGFSY